MEPTLAELAEHTEVHLLPRHGSETIRREGVVYVAGQRAANVHPYRVDDLDEAVSWAREESRRRGHKDVEWWVGWTAEPAGLGARLLDAGLARSDHPPTLVGMTCSRPPPPGDAAVEVRRVQTLEEYLAWAAVEPLGWESVPDDLEERLEREREWFAPMTAAGTVHHFAGLLGGRLVGTGRAVDMAAGVALWGGAVLREARGRGVYRALVRARWEHAAARGTPLLVVQAGPLSAPVLDHFGFLSHGEIELYCDRL